MEEIFKRIGEHLIDRVSGPMHFRVILQPLMASIFAVIAGIKDSNAGKPAYFWGLFTQPEHRSAMIRDGWKSVGKIFILAVILDIIYQLIVQWWVYPLEVFLVAFLFAIVPYILLRGPVNRVASLFIK